VPHPAFQIVHWYFLNGVETFLGFVRTNVCDPRLYSVPGEWVKTTASNTTVNNLHTIQP
jgi:hypothetical protein